MSRSTPGRYSFGTTAAIVTSMGIIVGFDATMPRSAVITSLLIIALADNLSDSLSIHVYQESEKLDGAAALRSTVTNFVARLLVALSFVVVVVALPSRWSVAVALPWGLVLLAVLTFAVARARAVKPWPEILKHLAIAVLVIVVSRAAAAVISSWMP